MLDRTAPASTSSESVSSGRSSHPVRHIVGAFLTVLLTVVAITVLATGSAAAGSPVAQVVQLQSDGCTLVPEAPAGVSFTPACNAHDACYALHASSRSGCDAAFYRDMLVLCEQARGKPNFAACRSWATVYYIGVRLFGAPFYNSSNPATRVLTPMAG